MIIAKEEKIAISKQSSSRDDKKKSYAKPMLKEIGGVNDLTKAFAIGNDSDGAGYVGPSL